MNGNSFKPAWWLTNPHLQTIWAVLCRSDIKNLELSRERIELPDGDFLDLDWIGRNEQKKPIIIVLPGFEGSIQSHYAKGMLRAIYKNNWRGVFMHFRGCSGEPNRLPRGYHSGETTDLNYIVKTLIDREPNIKIGAMGFSLGGNVLLKWLGETRKNNPLKAAVAISVPFELHKAASRIERGVSKLYEWYLVKGARKRLKEKFQQIAAPFDVSILATIQGIRDLDHKYTVPVHGFSSVDQYYASASSRQFLRYIEVPTLLLQAKDDPFMSEDVIPTEAELSSSIQLEASEAGGHVGFVSGKYPWRPEYWLEQRVPEFFKEFLS